MVVPLRIGGGSRLKIIEAAANGLPVASTLVGAEGLNLRPEKDYFAAETINEMVKPVLHAMNNVDDCAEAVSKAVKLQGNGSRRQLQKFKAWQQTN